MKVLIVGHSQTKYFSKYLPPSSCLDVSIISHSGFKIDEIWPMIKDVDMTDFPAIVLVLGANDLPVLNPPQILRNFQILVENIWRVNPGADIFLSSILPRAENLFKSSKTKRKDFIDTINLDAIFVNKSLGDISKCLKRLHFICHPCFVQCGKIRRNLLSKDGLHLSFAGTETVVRNIIHHLERFHKVQTNSKDV